MQDSHGETMTVVYPTKPGNFDDAISVAATGRYVAGKDMFEAEQLLVKCPSKYQEQEAAGGQGRHHPTPDPSITIMLLYFGTALVCLAIAAALGASASYALVTTGRPSLLRWGRLGTYAALGFALASAALLLGLFVAQRYDMQYVYDY